MYFCGGFCHFPLPLNFSHTMKITIQRLNMDNSWWVDFNGLRFLIDPWLQGVEVDFFPWFNTQWHRTKPLDAEAVPAYDFVLITQKYPDHFHAQTLLRLRPARLLVPASIEQKVKKLLPEAEVLTLQADTPRIFGGPLSLHFLPTSRRIDPIYDALLLHNGEESIFIATHGFDLTPDKRQWLSQQPPVSLLFTPFNYYRLPVWLGGVVSPGMTGVQQLVEAVKPRRVVATHDEDKFARGLVSRFARITRSPAAAELMQLPLLKDRYLAIDHYSSVVI